MLWLFLAAAFVPMPEACNLLTVARCAIEIEREWKMVGAPRHDAAVEKLERIARRVTRLFPRKPASAYTKTDAIRFFNVVNFVLKEEKLAPSEEAVAFSWDITNGRRDCSDGMFIFLDMAERVGLPLHGVSMPYHVFVRYGAGLDAVNWETTSGEVASDAAYIDAGKIDSRAVERGTYLRNLSRAEAFYVTYLELGTWARSEGRHETALAAYTIAQIILPDDPLSYTGWSGASLDVGANAPEEIADAAAAAILRDPSSLAGWQLLGRALQRKKGTERALKEILGLFDDAREAEE